MKFKLFNVVFACLLLSLSSLGSVAHAGLIENTTDGTFIDKTTGLEWMDFGVNNMHTYNEVASMMSTTYSGWALATESQVLTLWHNAFAGKASNVDYVSDTLATYASYTNYEATNIALTTIFEVMGYGDPSENWSLGWFENELGGLAYVHFSNSSPTYNYANIHGRNVDYESFSTHTSSIYSTMLVRNAEVPEPSTIAIFALGMIGLASRRFKE